MELLLFFLSAVCKVKFSQPNDIFSFPFLIVNSFEALGYAAKENGLILMTEAKTKEQCQKICQNPKDVCLATKNHTKQERNAGIRH